MNGQPPSTASSPATRVRYGVLGFACALSMVTYLDRVCFGTALGTIRESLGLETVGELKLAVTAFSISYALFEIPSGWLGDVYGPRKTLIRIVLWWSLFTALTAAVTDVGILCLTGLGLMVLVRFLFGVGEAGAYPNITRALHNWFPFKERGLAQGAVWMSGRLMGGLTPLVWWAIVEILHLSWRTAFCIFGAIGVVWCIAFASWFRNRPDENPSVNQAELDLINQWRPPAAAANWPSSMVDTAHESAHSGVPWLRLLTDLNLWTLCIMYFCASYGWYFNITYLPDYLESEKGVSKTSVEGAIYKGGPLLMGAVTCVVGGFLSDRFVRRTGNVRWGRRTFGIIGHSLCGLCYFACLFMPTAFTFFLAISFAAFWNDLTMGSAWATCQDIGRRYAAIVAGCMNTIGNLGGAAAGYVTGTIIQRRPQAFGLDHYQISFVIFGAVYLIAVLLWLRIDASRPVAGQHVDG